MESKYSTIIKLLRGREIIQYIHKVATLRIAIFREYPYLYQGDISYEERYLRMYSRTKNAILVIAENDNEVVGAITGLPLAESMQEIKDLFVKKNIPAERIFYLGEIILLPEYRNKNIGFMMYQQFEKAVNEMQLYKKIALCEVVREEKDLRKPQGYKSLDSFWNRQGYEKHKDLVAEFSWQEIEADVETMHPMVFWIKESL
ncbi:MAG: GNAT family N-acetyltransferase [Chlamydiota bacterium]|nr:GNAT family N-acetyltransferase [Chlamydiota bacterium]